jgi:hypothetical protein
MFREVGQGQVIFDEAFGHSVPYSQINGEFLRFLPFILRLGAAVVSATPGSNQFKVASFY